MSESFLNLNKNKYWRLLRKKAKKFIKNFYLEDISEEKRKQRRNFLKKGAAVAVTPTFPGSVSQASTVVPEVLVTATTAASTTGSAASVISVGKSILEFLTGSNDMAAVKKFISLITRTRSGLDAKENEFEKLETHLNSFWLISKNHLDLFSSGIIFLNSVKNDLKISDLLLEENLKKWAM